MGKWKKGDKYVNTSTNPDYTYVHMCHVRLHCRSGICNVCVNTICKSFDLVLRKDQKSCLIEPHL